MKHENFAIYSWNFISNTNSRNGKYSSLENNEYEFNDDNDIIITNINNYNEDDGDDYFYNSNDIIFRL